MLNGYIRQETSVGSKLPYKGGSGEGGGGGGGRNKRERWRGGVKMFRIKVISTQRGREGGWQPPEPIFYIRHLHCSMLRDTVAGQMFWGVPCPGIYLRGGQCHMKCLRGGIPGLE